ncbi:hypothetical protein VNO77_02573 [Canavalia gladiata]|uniref:Uncharacterized protein n=1 Tax=Canavalia gladiata TaxID=3824 RepID=A0AAN9MTW4_CANGL
MEGNSSKGRSALESPKEWINYSGRELDPVAHPVKPKSECWVKVQSRVPFAPWNLNCTRYVLCLTHLMERIRPRSLQRMIGTARPTKVSVTKGRSYLAR